MDKSLNSAPRLSMPGETRIRGGLVISAENKEVWTNCHDKINEKPPSSNDKKRAKNLLHESGALVDCWFRCFLVLEAELAKKPVDKRRESDKFRALKTRIWMPSYEREFGGQVFLSFGWAKTVEVLIEFSGVWTPAAH
jgi:hypothetical protein